MIIGNLALDGISAREMLVGAIIQSNFIDSILNALTNACNSEENFAIVEGALWALDNLFSEQSP